MQKRYWILDREGSALVAAPEPLQKYRFMLQACWQRSGALAFSQFVTAHKVVQTCGPTNIEGRDSLRLDLDLTAGVPLPDDWRSEGLDCLNVSVMMHSLVENAVAHLLTFTLQKVGTVPDSLHEHAEVGSPGARWTSVHELWQPPLPKSLAVEVDAYSFAADLGCGVDPDNPSSRAEVPWLAALHKDVDVSSLMQAPPTLRVEPLSIGFRFVDGAPRLKSMSFGLAIVLNTATTASITMPFQVSMLPGLAEIVAWA